MFLSNASGGGEATDRKHMWEGGGGGWHTNDQSKAGKVILKVFQVYSCKFVQCAIAIVSEIPVLLDHDPEILAISQCSFTTWVGAGRL